MHMRTTLDLPEELVEDARRLAGMRTKREAVVRALEEFVQAKRRAELIGMLGKTKMAVTQDDLEAMREDDDLPDPEEPMRLILPPKGKYPCRGKKRRTPRV